MFTSVQSLGSHTVNQSMTTNQSKTATPGKIFLALSQNEEKKTKNKKIETCMQSKYVP
jgi:hypothetical protein